MSRLICPYCGNESESQLCCGEAHNVTVTDDEYAFMLAKDTDVNDLIDNRERFEEWLKKQTPRESE